MFARYRLPAWTPLTLELRPHTFVFFQTITTEILQSGVERLESGLNPASPAERFSPGSRIQFERGTPARIVEKRRYGIGKLSVRSCRNELASWMKIQPFGGERGGNQGLPGAECLHGFDPDAAPGAQRKRNHD